ncbi:hypothetical protein BJ742DRAFT_744833 [Cladochytrium replicatum]|nr:hypothetical protein BJ742DRAFT_744833 [Cladochytrium replicatum]
MAPVSPPALPPRTVTYRSPAHPASRSAKRLVLNRWDTGTISVYGASSLLGRRASASAPTQKLYVFDYWPKDRGKGFAEDPPSACYFRLISDSPVLSVRVSQGGDSPPSSWNYQLTEEIKFEVETEDPLPSTESLAGRPQMRSASTTPFGSNLDLASEAKAEDEEKTSSTQAVGGHIETHYMTRLSLGYGRYIFLVTHFGTAPKDHPPLCTFRASVTHFITDPAPIPPSWFPYSSRQQKTPNREFPSLTSAGRHFNNLLSTNVGLTYRPFVTIAALEKSGEHHEPPDILTEFPSDAWPMGFDPLLGSLYSIRAVLTNPSTGSSGLHIGYCNDDGRIALIAYNGRAVSVDSFEILCLSSPPMTTDMDDEKTVMSMAEDTERERLERSSLCDVYTPIVPAPQPLARRTEVKGTVLRWVKTTRGVPPNAVFVGRESPADGAGALALARCVVSKVVIPESSSGTLSTWSVFARTGTVTSSPGKFKVMSLIPGKAGMHLRKATATCVVGDREMPMDVSEVLCWTRAVKWKGEETATALKIFANDDLEVSELVSGETEEFARFSGVWDEVDSPQSVHLPDIIQSPSFVRPRVRAWTDATNHHRRATSAERLGSADAPPVLKWEDDD